MVLDTIYIVRHGYRTNWVVDASTGTYHSSIRTPTGIPSDPALASYGVKQAEELATHLLSLDPRIDLIYSSPYYRCLQTLAPYATQLASSPSASPVRVNIEPGLGEFYGRASFTHPRPASIEELSTHFSHLYAAASGPIIESAAVGESIPQLHDRIAYCLDQLIRRADADPKKPRSLLACTHAASIICAGRVLTGRMPKDVGEEDFKAFTCGVSKFVRRRSGTGEAERRECEEIDRWSPDRPDDIPDLRWRDGKGVGGGWECVANSDCSFLSGGEERGWHFSGDESFLEDPNAFNDANNAANAAAGQEGGTLNAKSNL